MNKAFEFHKLNIEGMKKAVEIAEAFENLLQQLYPLLPISGRETDMIIDKLEGACFLSKKAMASQVENQE